MGAILHRYATAAAESESEKVTPATSETETIFVTAVDKETISKSLESLFNETNRNAMQSTPPRIRKQLYNHGPKNWKSTVFTPIYTTFRTNHEHISDITVFGISYRFHICQNVEQYFS